MNSEKAQEIIGDIMNAENDIGPSYRPWMYWVAGDEHICLDGDFDADELEALSWWMRNKSPNK